jgi:hypothetical protein
MLELQCIQQKKIPPYKCGGKLVNTEWSLCFFIALSLHFLAEFTILSQKFFCFVWRIFIRSSE